MYIAFNRILCYNTSRGGKGPDFRAAASEGRNTAVPVSKAQQKAVAKYTKANYDIYQVRMPKGKLDIIKTCSQAAGQSVNAYINQAVEERINRDNAAPSAAEK